MIKCTRNADYITRTTFGTSKTGFTKLETILSQITLDNKLQDPPVDAFIVTDEDIKQLRVKNTFETAVALKHPDNILIFVSRKGKITYTESAEGINRCLVKPKPEELHEIVYQLAGDLAEKMTVQSSQDTIEKEEIPEYTPDFTTPIQQDIAAAAPHYVEPVVEEPEHLPEPEPIEAPLPQEMVQEEPVKNSMAERIKQADAIAEVAILSKQLSAAEIVKQTIVENKQYATIESNITAIQEKIYTILADPNEPDITRRLEKARSVIYDKQYYKAKANTLIEQRVEEIIEALTTTTLDKLSSRIVELDKAIAMVKGNPQDSLTYSHITGIAEQRANIILELSTLEREIQNIYLATDKLAAGTAEKISTDMGELTGNPIEDARLKLTSDTLVDEDSVDLLANILTTASQTSDIFQEAVTKVKLMQNKLHKIMDLDKEQIAAYSAAIKYLESNHIEDTIIANTLIKKSLRIFVGQEGSGRTATVTTLSALKSRTNANVLTVDMTGKGKYADYGINTYSIEEWLANRYEQQLCFVSGEVNNTVESAQRMLTALVKAADFYRVINVIIDPSQTVLFETIAQDSLVVNYIVSPRMTDITFMKEVIASTRKDNVAQRTILTKCSVASEPIIEKLDLLNAMNMHICKIPYIAQVTDCGIKGIPPYTVESIAMDFSEVSKHA